jgi:hypothetical protein
MDKKMRIIAPCVLIILLLAGPVCAESNMDRIRAVESLSYFVEARFGAARLHRNDLDNRLTENLREPLDLDLISLTVASMLSSEDSGRGRLWVHKDFRRTVEKWGRLGGRLARDRIIVYDNTSRLIRDFNPKDDLAIMQTRDLERLALRNGHNLQNAVILSPLEIRLEYMDQIFVSLLLIRELKSMLTEDRPESVVETDKFITLRSLLETLLAMRSGFANNDILDMIPQAGLTFARRALAILQNSMNPIRRQDLKPIREVQTTLRGV